MIIANVTRTTDSNGRVWVQTEVRAGTPDPAPVRHVQQAGVRYLPDSELAGLASALRGC